MKVFTHCAGERVKGYVGAARRPPVTGLLRAYYGRAATGTADALPTPGAALVRVG